MVWWRGSFVPSRSSVTISAPHTEDTAMRWSKVMSTSAPICHVSMYTLGEMTPSQMLSTENVACRGQSFCTSSIFSHSILEDVMGPMDPATLKEKSSCGLCPSSKVSIRSACARQRQHKTGSRKAAGRRARRGR
eukprot:scaffold99903_cov58-Phaeocystis_antarctica.AAC.6